MRYKHKEGSPLLMDEPKVTNEEVWAAHARIMPILEVKGVIEELINLRKEAGENLTKEQIDMIIDGVIADFLIQEKKDIAWGQQFVTAPIAPVANRWLMRIECGCQGGKPKDRLCPQCRGWGCEDCMVENCPRCHGKVAA